jgi:peptidoglycan/LPS O-acetylase OafA/YrhL
MKREIELDFIRGIAILLVLDSHSPLKLLFYPFRKLGYTEHFGWVGVNIFFVLSGFLVGGLLVKEWMLSGRIQARQFLLRRGFKIWPQYYVYLLLLVVTGHRGFLYLLPHFLNVQNYFPSGTGHTWSLAVEEHAYLLLTFGLVLAARRRLGIRHLFLILGALSFCVSMNRLYETTHGYSKLTYYYSTHTRIDGIFYGLMLALLYHGAPEIFRRMQTWRWLWIAIIVGMIAFARIPTEKHLWAASVVLDLGNAVGIATLMLLYRHREGHKRPAPYRLLAWIGVYSYGIYLWHISVIVPVGRLAQHLPGWLAFACNGFGPMLAGIALGVFFTKLVEFPALRLRERLIPRRVDSAVGTPAEMEAKA